MCFVDRLCIVKNDPRITRKGVCTSPFTIYHLPFTRMRPLRYSINVTLDGCCDHRAIPADEDLHRHAVDNLNQADALLFGRVTYKMMEAAFRPLRGGSEA